MAMELEQRPSARANTVTKYWAFPWSGVLSPMKSYPVVGIGSMFFYVGQRYTQYFGQQPYRPRFLRNKDESISLQPSYSQIVH